MKVDHEFDLRANCVSQRGHHSGDTIDLGQKRAVVRVGDDHDLHRAIAERQNVVGALDQQARGFGLVDGAHVAKTEMRVDPDPIARLAAEEPPHGQAKRLAENIPARDLYARNRAHSDRAQTPETVLFHGPHDFFDVARVTSNDQRGKVLDCGDDRARLPLQSRFAPSG